MSPWNESKSIDARINEDAQKTESLFSSACIYKVPEELRKLKKSAYTPRLIAIGPLHRKDDHLKTPMQYVKGSYTNHLLSRLTEGETDPKLAKQKRSRVLEECVAEIKRSIDDAKKCYADEVELDVEMLMIDGCFIVELLYMRSLLTEPPLGVEGSTKMSHKVDPIFGSPLTAETVKLDLLIIENQIPFFVLKKLFRLTIDKIPNRPDKKTLDDLVRVYFQNMMSPENNSTTSCGSPSDSALWISGNKMGNAEEKEVVISTDEYYHILHILHEYYRPNLNGTKKIQFNEHMPSASNLEYAGVKFVPGKGKDLFNVKFNRPQGLLKLCHRATFEIPTLGIYDLTEAFLRNMIAFEQCCHGVSQHFTSYGYLMDMLVNSKEDIESLEKAGVLRNYLGASEDATDLFNKLCKEVGVGEFFFAEECDEATTYGNSFWPNNMAHLKRTYFASPWTFKAFCAGFIAFVISVIQFVEKYIK